MIKHRSAAPASRLDGAAIYWCADLQAEWSTFSLHPPIAFDIQNDADAYRCLMPYASGLCDLAVGDAGPRRTRLRAGSLWFVPPGLALGLRSIEPVEFLLLSVAPARLRDLADATAPGRAWDAHILLNHRDPALAGLAQEIRRALLSDAAPPAPYLQSLADAVTTRLLCHFLGEVQHVARDEALSPVILSRVLRHIEANMAADVSVSALAGLAQLTRSHFSRAFQSMTGEPPQRFLLKRRVCRARDLLSSGEGTLAEVATRAGFSSQAHLSTAFRKEVGTTPGEYRAAFRGQAAGKSDEDESA